MKKIVVFGASGDTGQYFIKYFLEHYSGSEYQVVATGTRATDYFSHLNVPYYRVDIDVTIRNESDDGFGIS
jgi:UDP-glucose 4-epimerase